MPDIAYSCRIQPIVVFVATAAVRYSRVKRAGFARRLIVLIAAFSFALQCYIAQTHIHGVPLGFDGAVKTAAEQLPGPSKTPIDHSSTQCPFCQAIVHAGAVVVSTTPILNLPFAWIRTATLIVTVQPSSDLTAHEWQSRGPPRR